MGTTKIKTNFNIDEEDSSGKRLTEKEATTGREKKGQKLGGFGNTRRKGVGGRRCEGEDQTTQEEERRQAETPKKQGRAVRCSILPLRWKTKSAPAYNHSSKPNPWNKT